MSKKRVPTARAADLIARAAFHKLGKWQLCAGPCVCQRARGHPRRIMRPSADAQLDGNCGKPPRPPA